MAYEDRSEQRRKRVMECVQYYKAGWSEPLIAARMEVDIKTVQRYLRSAGLRKNIPRTLAVMQGAIYPEEIERYKEDHGVGSKVKIIRTAGNYRKEYMGEILAVHTHFARTDYGCIRWADLVRYNRNIAETEEHD